MSELAALQAVSGLLYGAKLRYCNIPNRTAGLLCDSPSVCLSGRASRGTGVFRLIIIRVLYLYR
jgi:hypothetical protein